MPFNKNIYLFKKITLQIFFIFLTIQPLILHTQTKNNNTYSSNIDYYLLKNIKSNRNCNNYNKNENLFGFSNIDKFEIQSQIPSDLIIPAEFEEVQAILISWPSYAFDSLDNLVTSFTPGYGIKYQADTFELVPIAYYKLNLVNESPLVKIFEQLTKEVQKECSIWIRLPQDSDSSLLKKWFDERGHPLYNYKFIISKDGINSIWMRDCGPIGCYYNNMDSIALLNFEYYPNAPIDDDLPILISRITNYKVLNSSLELEGGNFLTDGYENIFTSSIVYEANSDTIGKAYFKKIPKNYSEIENELKSTTNKESVFILDKLNCDGGTGHLDFYLKFINENTVIFNSYPVIYNNPNFPDYKIIESNKKRILSHKSVFDEEYKSYEIQIPPSDDGNFTNIDCQSYSLNPRTYTNSLFVNKMLIYPKYSNEYDGYSIADKIAEVIYSELLPGYRLVGIDCRSMIRSGGAIHCLAQQIPAENPIRILHKPFNKEIPLTNQIEIITKVTANKEIENVYCYWKKKYDLSWKRIHMQLQLDSYKAVIHIESLSNMDTIFYYIEAINSDGKKALKPITAPEGYYTITFTSDNPTHKFSAKLFPNPINETSVLFIRLNNPSNIKIEIYDCLGKLQKKLFEGYLQAGAFIKEIDLPTLGKGIYYAKILIENEQTVIPFLKMN